jgi:hypothetical protein
MWDQNDRPKAQFLSATNDLTGRRHQRWWLILWQKPKITKHVITSHSHNIDISIFPCHKIYLSIYIYMFASMFSRSIQYFDSATGASSKALLLCPSSFPPPVKRRGSTRWCEEVILDHGFLSQESTKERMLLLDSIGFYWILLDSIRYQWKKLMMNLFPKA